MKKVFIQVQADDRERKMLKEIAEYRHQSMSEVVRSWIRKSHSQMGASK